MFVINLNTIMLIAIGATWISLVGSAGIQPLSSAVPQKYQPQLRFLAEDVKHQISSPIMKRFYRDKAYESFVSALRVACIWPRDEFKAPLKRALEGSDVNLIIWAARGLLNYQTENLTSLVKRVVNDDRLYLQTGCTRCPLSSAAADVLRAFDEMSINKATEPGGLWDHYVPSESQRHTSAVMTEPDFMLCRTLPQAVHRLSSTNDRVRFEAFRWLHSYGVVVDADPLTRYWPRLWDSEMDKLFASWECPLVGREQLKQALEQLLLDSVENPGTDSSVASLMRGLSAVRSDKARTLSRRILSEYLSGTRKFEEDYCASLLLDACMALSLTGCDADQSLAFELMESSIEELRLAGVYVAAGSNSREATEAVLRHIRKPANKEGSIIKRLQLDPLRVLEQREWIGAETKWRYVDGLSSILVAYVSNEQTQDTRLHLFPVRIIHTLEAITQVSNGDDGYSAPDGFDLEQIRATTQNWREWANRQQERIRRPALQPGRSGRL